jgi:serine/threonine protein phosphatase PrpC
LALELQFGSRTDTGWERFKNEDAHYADPQKGVFIVADGLGGHRAGEVASRTAIEEIMADLQDSSEPQGRPQELRAAIERANRTIYERSLTDRSLSGMGTTVVVARVAGRELWIAHVGDSRAYRLTEEGHLMPLTQDHVLSLAPSARGPLARAVGVEPDVQVDLDVRDYGGETVLLCTDGLTDMVTDAEIEDILKKAQVPQEACAHLVDLANDRGGKDNVTVVIFKGSRQAPPIREPQSRI